MILSGKFKVNAKYTGVSKFRFWNDLEPGDIIEIKFKIQNICGTPMLEVVSNYADSGFIDYAGNILKYLGKLEVTQIN